MEISKVNKCAEMLEEEKYWTIVKKSLVNFKNEEEQTKKLVDELKKLSVKEMIGFALRTEKLSNEIYTSDMWCAAYIVNGGCSDDGFEYFRSWIISKGKEAFYRIKEKPDAFIEYANLEIDAYDFEQFNYVALDAFKELTGEHIYDFIDYPTFRKTEKKSTRIQFNWSEENPDSIKTICPQLFDKFLAPLIDQY